MKKRIVCLFLSAVLLFGLLPLVAPSAKAESLLTYSQECVELLKSFEGFAAKPYWDYAQYTVGYGTRCPDDKYDEYMERGITEEEAEALLRTYMDAFGKSVNRFNDKHSLNLTQNQFDALLLFSFGCGTAWMYDEEGQFRGAVLSGATGNEFIHPITLWCSADGTILPGLIRRRLCEANIYLNGVYATTAPENYSYVYYNANGGKTKPRIQGYDTTLTADPIPVPTYEGHTFDGWYTAASGGNKIETLDASVAGSTLYAHWTVQEGGTITGTSVNYKREITADSLDIYDQPIDGANVVGSVKKGEIVSVIAEYKDDSGKLWGKIEGKGWIDLSSTKESAENEGTPIDPLTVKVLYYGVNLRKGAGTSYPIVGVANTGDTFTITATESADGYLWGKYDGGWIALTFTNYDDVVNTAKPTQPNDDPTLPAMGTVTSSDGLRIRSGAGTNYEIVGFLDCGERVQVLEKTTSGAMSWGKIDKGWICLDYVRMDEPTQTPDPAPVQPEKPATSVMGTVNTDDLRIRSGPSTAYSILGYLYTGDRVEITEQKSSGSMMWGKIDKGWISLDYVVLDSEMPEEPTEPTEPTESEYGIVHVEEFLRIRTGPSTNYAIAGYLHNGDRVEITEKKSDGYTMWGKIDKGWISLDYVEMESAGTTPEPQPAPQTQVKTVIADCLHIRSAAGTDNPIVGYLYEGAKVEILETTTAGGRSWGRISKGWICMEYVK